MCKLNTRCPTSTGWHGARQSAAARLRQSAAAWLRQSAAAWLLACGCALPLLAGCDLPDRELGVTRLELARFAIGGAETTTVRLPHTWPGDPPSSPTTATYRLTFEPTPSAGGFGIFVTRTSMHFSAHINGHEVYETGTAGSSPLRAWRVSPVIRIPRGLLKPGVNELELRVITAATDTPILGPLLVGGTAAIDRIAMLDLLGHTLGPLMVSGVIATVGLFVLAMWSRRRDGPLYALIGFGALLWGIHTAFSALPFRPLPPPHYGIWWTTVYLWVVMMLSAFALRFVGVEWRAFERTAIAYAVVVAPALYLAHAADRLALAGATARGLGIVFVLAALTAVVRQVFRSRNTEGLLMLVAGAISAAFAIHDWIRVQFGADAKPVLLTPYAAVLFLVLAGWMLVERFNRTQAAFEMLNLDLERRVAETGQALRLRLAEVQSAREEAERASAAKSRFFAAASHDLRQPLHSLGMFTSALLPHVATGPGREIATRMSESITSLESLFNELLDISKVDSGATPVQLRNVGLQAMFDRLSLEFHAQATERNLGLRFVPSSLAVRSDRVLLERIVANLVSNALRYTAAGGVLVGARRRGEEVWLEVWDTGIGIPAAEQGRVFEEFYQVGNPSRDRRLGLGLGLAIVERLSSLLGHRVTLASRPGRGTRFRVELPLAQGDTEIALAEAAAPPLTVMAGARVLVVDDEDSVRESTEALLAQWGCELRLAASLPEVMSAVSGGFVPDAAIVDLRLGADGTGLDVVRELRQRLGADLPVLLISGDTATDTARRARDSGIALLTKPVAPAKLRSALHAILLRERVEH